MKDLVNIAPILRTDFQTVFAEFLRIDVSNGDARPDTIRAYLMHVRKWGDWCRGAGLDPAHATQETVKAYRKDLIDQGAKHATIALKLTVIRRFYAAALARGLVAYNPAEGVRPPRDRKAAGASMKFLTDGELELLFRAIPKTNKAKDLRDRAMIALMAFDGWRDVEVHRACVEDVQPDGQILVHGKGRDKLIVISDQSRQAIDAYLASRGPVEVDAEGTPLFTAEGNRAGGARIGREGIRTVINRYLTAQGIKRPGMSCHALRHTCASRLYSATKDPCVVMEHLRHASLEVTTRYIHSMAQSKTAWGNLVAFSI